MSIRSAKEIWEAAKGSLQIQVNKANYETWLKDTHGISYRSNQFVVGTPSAFASEWLEKRLQSLVKKTLIGIIGEDIEVQFQVCSPVTDSLRPSSASSKSDPRYTFDNFVVGKCNRLAYAAALGVSEEPGRKYNPLFIHGGPGSGKTHLTCAIENAASENGYNALYTSSEKFTNEFINSIKEKRTEEFRNKFRNVDLLLLDDIHFISGKPQTQEGLFHTFNELHNANRQVVITSDRPPGSLALLESRLSSRFEWGIITSIQYPDLETRLAILQSKADRMRVQLDEAVFELIAQRCKQTIRQLEGSLNRLIAYAKLSGTSPTLELADKVIQDFPKENISPHQLTPEFILSTVANHFTVRTVDLKSKKRDPNITLPRQIAIHLIREKSNHSLKDIGTILGGRDHSTILHAHQKITAELKSNPKLQKEVNKIVRKLNPSELP